MRCGLGSVRSRLLVGKALSLLLPVAAQTPTAVRLQDVQANMKTATNVVYIVFGFLVVNVFFLNLLIGEVRRPHEAAWCNLQRDHRLGHVRQLCQPVGARQRFFLCTLPRFRDAYCL